MDDSLEIDVNPIFATTHLVHQTVFTVESLYDAAASLTGKARKPFMIPEHDHLCPPMGQTIGATVVQLDDGHHALVGQYDIFPPPSEVELPFGGIGYQQQSAEHRFPLTVGEFETPATFTVSADATNFGGVEGIQTFFSELKGSTAQEFDTQMIGRRSVIPDPEIVFSLGLKASVAWLGVRVAKAAADAIEPELQNFFSVLIKSVKESVVNAIPKYRPVTFVLRVHGKPNLELIARTRDADAVITAMANEDLSSLQPKIEALRKRFDAEMVQFKLTTDGEWTFNYLVTREGLVVGTKEAYDHRAFVLKEMKMKRNGKLKDA
jgi:hypothetical protein